MQPFCIRQRRNVCYTIINYSIQLRCCCCCCCPCGSCCLHWLFLLLLLLLYPWHLANASPRNASRPIQPTGSMFLALAHETRAKRSEQQREQNSLARSWCCSCSLLRFHSCFFFVFLLVATKLSLPQALCFVDVCWVAQRELYFGKSAKCCCCCCCCELWLQAAGQLLLQLPHTHTQKHPHSGTFLAVTNEIWFAPKTNFAFLLWLWLRLNYISVCLPVCECVLMRRSCCWLPFIVLFGICFGNTKLMITTALLSSREPRLTAFLTAGGNLQMILYYESFAGFASGDYN